MEVINSILGVLGFCLGIFYFRLYHRIFSIVYLKDMSVHLIWEFLICFFLGLLTVYGIGKGAFVLLGFLGKGMVFLLKLVLLLGIVGAMGGIGYKILKKFRK